MANLCDSVGKACWFKSDPTQAIQSNGAIFVHVLHVNVTPDVMSAWLGQYNDKGQQSRHQDTGSEPVNTKAYELLYGSV